jgi:hypothetical protein
MVKEETRGVTGLFRAMSKDGAHWRFVILPDGGWEITRDAELIVGGTGVRTSLGLGVRRFLLLILRSRAPAGPAAPRGAPGPIREMALRPR